MFPKFLQILWGDLSKDEIKKFGILSATFFLIIGTYWMLRVMKNPIFAHFIGFKWQPVAKIVSLIFVGIMVLVYSKLVDLFEKQNLFYIICTFYGFGFICLAFLMQNPNFALLAPSSTIGKFFQWIPGKLVGWLSYIFLESFGSIVVALFWSFVSSTTTTESAKRGYGMIMSLTQIGTILGPWIVTRYARVLGLPILFGIGGLVVFAIPLLIKFYMVAVPAQITTTSLDKTSSKTGFGEGLRLLFSKTYLLGILAIATLYEIVGTILEFQMNMLAEEIYQPKLDGGIAFAWFEGIFGITVGILALLFALIGTSFFMRKFGLKFCLMTFPATIGITTASVFFSYKFGISSFQLMWITFIAMVMTKTLNYALNNPTKEILYIPTSQDARFKAKGWIDAFGSRTSKALGAGVTGSLGSSISVLLTFGTLATIGITGLWIFVAIFVGNKYDLLLKENTIVE